MLSGRFSFFRGALLAVGAFIAIVLYVALVSPRLGVQAQTSVQPSPVQPRSRSSAARNSLAIDQLPRLEAPAINAAERRRFYRNTDPDRISEPWATQLDPHTAGVWETLTDGSRMWRLRVEAPGSLTMALVFHNFQLPEHAQMFVYATTGEPVRSRPYTWASNPRDGVFAAGPLRSDEAVVEIDVPAAEEREVLMTLTQVNRGFTKLAALVSHVSPSTSSPPSQYDEVDTSQPCEVNVACPDGQGKFRDNTNSVGLIVTPEGRLCSGSFINSVPSNFAPYFLTASHCGPVSGWTVITSFESQTCAIGGASSLANQITNWVEVASNNVSDFLLIQTLEPIPPSYNVYFNAWFAQNLVPQSGAAVLHHPLGNVQKISATFEPLSDGTFLGIIQYTDWRINAYNVGITEPGSSGGPLINTNLQVIGQVHGGFSSCNPYPGGPDYFGKFSLSFSSPAATETQKLAPFIDPQGIAANSNLTGYGGYPPGSLMLQTGSAINTLLQTTALPPPASALLQDAANQINNAMDAQYWNGPAQLYSISGPLVFLEASAAAQDLSTLLTGYSKYFPAGSLQGLLSIANPTVNPGTNNPLYDYQPASLIGSVRAIATVAELSADSSVLAQINTLLANGDTSANNGSPVQAILHYQQAWQLAATPAQGLLLATLASPPNGGTVVPSSNFYPAGTQVNVVANANPGWMLGSWSGPLGAGQVATCAPGTSCSTQPYAANTGSVSMNSPAVVTAHFVPAPSISIRVSQKSGPMNDRTWSIGFTNNSTSTISELALNPITWSSAFGACVPVALPSPLGPSSLIPPTPALVTNSLGPGQSSTIGVAFDFSACGATPYQALIPASFVFNNQTVAIQTTLKNQYP